jgi:cytochrome c-type biogenesis protein CcmH
VLSDKVLEARARTLSAQLRCLVCQNQSIDDSDAPLAKDLRLLVRERLVAGDTDPQVLDFLVDRYGEFVLLKPPFNRSTYILWLAPFALFLIAALFIIRRVSRPGPAARTGLSADEEAELAKILEHRE